jgi:hypothetical protein
MSVLRIAGRGCVCLGFVSGMFSAGSAQEHATGGPLAELPILDAPFTCASTTSTAGVAEHHRPTK